MISYIVLGITIAFIFFMPIDVFLPTVLWLYSVLLISEWKVQHVKKIDILIFCVYTTMFVAFYLLGFENLVPYTGQFFYFSLGVLSILGALIRRPITLPRDATKAKVFEHMIMNYMLGIGYFTSLCISIVLFPKPSYIWLPMAVTAGFLMFCIPLSTFNAGFFKWIKGFLPLQRADKQHLGHHIGNWKGYVAVKKSSGLIGKEVITQQDEETFLSGLKRGYYAVYQRSNARHEQSFEDFFSSLVTEYHETKSRSSSFYVYSTHHHSCVGTIRVVYSDTSKSNGNVLPLESYIPVSLQNYRDKEFRCAEIGRLTILSNGPQRFRVLEILIELMIVKIMMRNVDFIFTDAVADAVRIYEKMGLKANRNSFFDGEIGQETYLCRASITELLRERQIAAWEKMKMSLEAQFFIPVILGIKRVQDYFRYIKWGNISHMRSSGTDYVIVKEMI